MGDTVKFPGIPSIPAGLSPGLYSLLSALKQNTELVTGQRGVGAIGLSLLSSDVQAAITSASSPLSLLAGTIDWQSFASGPYDFTQNVGAAIRDLTAQAVQIAQQVAEVSFALENDVQTVQRSLTSKAGALQADYNQLIYAATGPNSAISGSIAAISAVLSGYSGQGAVANAVQGVQSQVQTLSGQVTATAAEADQLSAALAGYTDASAVANALQTINTNVTANSSSITTQSGIITALQNTLAGFTPASPVTTALALKADAAAVQSVQSLVGAQGDTLVSQSNAITALQNTLVGYDAAHTVGSALQLKADATALSTLQSAVSTQGGVVTSQGLSITALQNALTGYSGTNAVATAFSTLQTSVTNLQSLVTSAVSALSTIAADNLLVASEKTTVRQMWDGLASEVSSNTSLATTFSVTTEKTAYTAAYTALGTYLNAGTAWSSGEPAWISDANLGTTTAIDSTTFLAKWNNYFNARTTLQNAINTAVSNTAVAANTAAAAAQTTANTAAAGVTSLATLYNGVSAAVNKLAAGGYFVANVQASQDGSYSTISLGATATSAATTAVAALTLHAESNGTSWAAVKAGAFFVMDTNSVSHAVFNADGTLAVDRIKVGSLTGNYLSATAVMPQMVGKSQAWSNSVAWHVGNGQTAYFFDSASGNDYDNLNYNLNWVGSAAGVTIEVHVDGVVERSGGATGKASFWFENRCPTNTGAWFAMDGSSGMILTTAYQKTSINDMYFEFDGTLLTTFSHTTVIKSQNITGGQIRLGMKSSNASLRLRTATLVMKVYNAY